jgi:hypothetical protein
MYPIAGARSRGGSPEGSQRSQDLLRLPGRQRRRSDDRREGDPDDRPAEMADHGAPVATHPDPLEVDSPERIAKSLVVAERLRQPRGRLVAPLARAETDAPLLHHATAAGNQAGRRLRQQSILGHDLHAPVAPEDAADAREPDTDASAVRRRQDRVEWRSALEQATARLLERLNV